MVSWAVTVPVSALDMVTWLINWVLSAMVSSDVTTKVTEYGPPTFSVSMSQACHGSPPPGGLSGIGLALWKCNSGGSVSVITTPVAGALPVLEYQMV